MVQYGDYYTGRPGDLILAAGDIFIEFDADDYAEWQGFQLQISVRNISGMIVLFRQPSETSWHVNLRVFNKRTLFSFDQ